MSDADKQKPEGRPESPTTARELDFDDDEPASHPQTPAKDVTHASTATKSPAAGNTASSNTASAPEASQNAAQTPSQPDRPLSPREQAELTLHEAFPTIEASVVKAVLAASGGQVEPAFHALLGMTDPDSATSNETQQYAPPPGRPPRQPPRPVQQAGGGGAPRSQLEADELYARQLAEHYQRQDASAVQRSQMRQQGRQQAYGEEDRERNFIDDDLPEIGENIRKGFMETQQKFNGWLSSLKKKMDGDEDEPPQLPARRQTSGPGAPRRSDDLYDADPEEFTNDFSRLELRDETAQAPKQPARRANPDLFKPTPAPPHDGRRVSFQEGPPEEIGAPGDAGKAGNKASKWQPLSSVDPTPVSEHDPFSLGDSDEDETKKNGSDKKDDASRLAKATAEAMAGEIGGESEGGKLELKDNTEDKK